MYTHGDLDLLFDLSEAILCHIDHVVAGIDPQNSKCARTIGDLLSDRLATLRGNRDVRAHNHGASGVLHASCQGRRVLSSRNSDQQGEQQRNPLRTKPHTPSQQSRAATLPT